MANGIVIAEDDVGVGKILEFKLRKEKFDVRRAHNGEEALELCRAGTPDLVLTDLMMPKVDGLRLIESMRADADLIKVPVIVLSALSQEQDKMRAFKAGADDYLTKPFSVVELVARVRKLIEREQAAGREPGSPKKDENAEGSV